ncbi:MAG: SDR family oxidoreductase [Salinibacterium sp.]|nr:SDR family oxidoreductase [Salinibacterium sp.]
MKIAVAGGTGAVGRHVVDVITERGHDPLVLARSRGVDLVTGEGLSLAGVQAVIDVVSTNTQSTKESAAFFAAVTRNLLAAEAAASVAHHVALGIVGSVEAPFGYYAGKKAQEELVEAAPVGWTILRATQFHEFASQLYSRVRLGPIHLAPKMVSQPVAAREVAEHLVDLAIGTPVGHAKDLAGPRVEKMVDMMRAYAKATGGRGPIIETIVPGGFGTALRNGTILPGPAATLGKQTYAEWLAALP